MMPFFLLALGIALVSLGAALLSIPRAYRHGRRALARDLMEENTERDLRHMAKKIAREARS